MLGVKYLSERRRAIYSLEQGTSSLWPVQGFKVSLHVPGEIPRVSKQFFRVPLSREVVVTVTPKMIVLQTHWLTLNLRDVSAISVPREIWNSSKSTHRATANWSANSNSQLLLRFSGSWISGFGAEQKFQLNQRSYKLRKNDVQLFAIVHFNQPRYRKFPGRLWLSRLTIIFKHEHFILSERAVIFDLIDFGTNCGGVLGEKGLIKCLKLSFPS